MENVLDALYVCRCKPKISGVWAAVRLSKNEEGEEPRNLVTSGRSGRKEQCVSGGPLT